MSWHAVAAICDRAKSLGQPHPLRQGREASTIHSTVLSETRVRQFLQPFGLELSSDQLNQVVVYLDLLLRWNQKINLTAIRDPEECLTRHFGESLFLAKHTELQGTLLDIGSGAGFPGLALKIAYPALTVTLLEPVAKKRAFLKEAARACGFSKVETRAERLQDLARISPSFSFDSATSRAVGNLQQLVPLAAHCLKPGGRIFLWLTRDQGSSLSKTSGHFSWAEPLAIPLSRAGQLLRGTKSY